MPTPGFAIAYNRIMPPETSANVDVASSRTSSSHGLESTRSNSTPQQTAASRLEQPSLFEDEELPPLLLMSLRPKWHQKFQDGSKTLEYRTKFLERAFSAVVYLSGEGRAISAFATFEDPFIGSPAQVVAFAVGKGEANASGLLGYFGGRRRVLAIPVQTYRAMPEIPLARIRTQFPNFQPPQSYIFLDRAPDLLAAIAEAPGWRGVVEPWLRNSWRS